MKRFLLIALIFTLCHPVFAQNIPTIKAKDAASYVGKLVYLEDTIRSGKIVTDSMAVIKVGGKLDRDAVSVVISSRGSGHSLDERVIGTLRAAHASFKGVIIPVQSTFIIFIDKQDNIKFNGPFPE